MAERAGIKVHGTKELRRTLKQAGDNLKDLKTVNRGVGEYIARGSRGSAPRRSGALAASARASSAVSKVQVLVGRASVPYAGPIHWGWAARNISPNPWVANTAIGTQGTWLPMYERGIQKELDKVRGA